MSDSCCPISSSDPRIAQNILPKKYSLKRERELMKAFFLERLHNLFCKLFYKAIQQNKNNLSTEYYMMDNQIMCLLIHNIIQTGEYTLEGIAYHTRIPFDVIYDAACGNNIQFSTTLWARVVNLFLEVKPQIKQILVEKLLKLDDENQAELLMLINEL